MGRRAWLGAGLGMAALLLGAAVGTWILLDGDADDGVSAALEADGAVESPVVDSGSAPTSVAGAVTTVDPATLVALDDVWLLDGGDGSYDWGLVVVGGDLARRDIDVTVRLRDASGGVVFTATDSLRELGPAQRSAIGGTARALLARPVRIETDVSVGFAVDDDAVGAIDVRAVERRIDPRSNDGSEVVVGRIRSTSSEEVEDLRLAAIWRAPADAEGVRAGDVVAVLFRDVERVRPGIDARFEIPVSGLDVPDGPPQEIIVTR